jgi:hypothetical protein
LLEGLKVTAVDDHVEPAAQMIQEALIETELSAVMGTDDGACRSSPFVPNVLRGPGEPDPVLRTRVVW